MNELVIKIYEASDGEGYIYDIYTEDNDIAEPVDGGQCTTTLENALEMAYEQAHAVLVFHKQ
jgi:IMP cyclohydrolase